MDQIPILEFNGVLVVSLQGDIYDSAANKLQEDIGQRLSESTATGILIDISALDIVDTYIGRVLGTISEMASIMGTKTVVVGMQPSVAITLVELGMELKNILTAINMNQGMHMLQGDGASILEEEGSEESEDGNKEN